MLHKNQENVHPFQQGIPLKQWLLDDISAQAENFRKNMPEGWKDRYLETKGLQKTHTARDNYGWKSL